MAGQTNRDFGLKKIYGVLQNPIPVSFFDAPDRYARNFGDILTVLAPDRGFHFSEIITDGLDIQYEFGLVGITSLIHFFLQPELVR